MAGDQLQILPRWRSRPGLHWAFVGLTAAALLTLYYGHLYSLPGSLGSSWGFFWSLFYFEYTHDLLAVLLLIPISYAMVSLDWRKGLIVTAAMLVAISPYLLRLSDGLALATSLSVLLIPPALFASAEIKLISDAKERLAREEKKRERAEILRHIHRAQEDERKRIAQELHDGVAQTLVAAANLTHNLLRRDTSMDASTRKELEAVKEYNLTLVTDVRRICTGLRPSILDSLGLVSAINWVVDDLREETGTDVQLQLTGQAYELGPEENVVVFRVVQEALRNASKHAQASTIQVALEFAATGLTVEVTDNGKGFEPVRDPSRFAVTGRLGLLGMSERMQAIGGTLSIESTVGLGTTVRIFVASKRAGRTPESDGSL